MGERCRRGDAATQSLLVKLYAFGFPTSPRYASITKKIVARTRNPSQGDFLYATIKVRKEVLHMMETKRCAYCKALRLESLMLFKIDGLHFCNRGHYREYIREKPIEPVQMDMFPPSQQQPLPETQPIKPMLDECPIHRIFQHHCRWCNPR